MLKAKNIYGDIVLASNASRYQDYYCLDCNAPVNLRAGRIKQPHFGHWRDTASENCQYYHRGYDNDYNPYHPVDVQTFTKPKSRAFWNAGFYLSGGLGTSLDLCLLLPHVGDDPAWAGEVVINGKWGEVSFRARDLQSQQYVPVPFSRPLSKIIKFQGNVDSDYQQKLDNLFDLNPDWNCFNFSEKYGRKLDSKDCIFWGQKYWVLANVACFSPPDELEILASEFTRHWKIYFVQLPLLPPADNTALSNIISWMKHEIKHLPKALEILAPLPLRIAKDGAYIISPETKYAIINSVDEGICAFNKDGSETETLSVGPDIYCVELSTETTIGIGNERFCCFRKLSISLFNPSGLNVQIGNDSFELPFSNTIVSSTPSNIPNIKFLVNDDRVQAFLAERILLATSNINDPAKVGKLCSIDLESFGSLFFSFPQSQSNFDFLRKEHASLLKLLNNLAASQHDNSLRLPFAIPDNAPPWLKRFARLRWDGSHMCYLMQLQQLLSRGSL